MGKIEKFSEKIQEHLDRIQKERSESLLEVDRDMKRLLEESERFSGIAHRIMASEIYPRMQELSRHFENSKVMDVDEIDGLCCFCDFSHTQRFPATVSLSIALHPGQNYASLDIQYKLKIFPMLLEYRQSDEHSFLLETLNEDDIGDWVEAKFLEFLDTYVKLETHPLYQKDNFVVDPVCGMRIPLVTAADKVEQDGRVVYFCSEACKNEFLKKKK